MLAICITSAARCCSPFDVDAAERALKNASAGFGTVLALGAPGARRAKLQPVDDELLAEQVAYYRARAPEFDRWWERTDQYTLDPELHAQWDADKRELTALVDGWLAPFRGGRALDLASGTGIWTSRLAQHFGEVVAVDAAPEAIEIARAKLPPDANVRFVAADVFAWEPDSEFDVVFFSFWVSHVPPDRFAAFWSLVGRALAPGGRAVFIDNKPRDGVWPPVAPDADAFVELRTDLSSGVAHRIVKIYYEPEDLEERLAAFDWHATVTSTNRFFVAGFAER
jgi:demethylmenaquinone methyltransferase/2-methoxy-6-polyprenyl-1,4-benzoquinol methylase